MRPRAYPPSPPFCPPPPPPFSRRVHDGKGSGVLVRGAGTKGRLEGVDIARQAGAGLQILGGADPLAADCTCVERKGGG